MDSGGPLFPWLQWGKNIWTDNKVSVIGNLLIDKVDIDNIGYLQIWLRTSDVQNKSKIAAIRAWTTSSR